MTWIDLLWPMVTGACLTLGFINLRIGFTEKPRGPRLLFSLSAFAVAFVSVMELALMRAESAARYEALLPWGDFATWATMSALTAFVWAFFGTGKRWVAIAGAASYGLGLLFYFGPDSGLLYLKITGVRTVQTYGGATFQVAEGVPNPWGLLGYIGVLLMLIFAVDATVRLWCRGNGRRAIIVGGSLAFFILAAGVQAALVERGIIQSPYLISWFYLAVLIAMGHELAEDVFAAAKLGWQLHESEQRMSLATESADLGLWVWDIPRDEIWVTPRFRTMFGFGADESITFAAFRSRVHPEDREAVARKVRSAVEGKQPYDVQYRLALPDGSERWIAAVGRAESKASGASFRMNGVCRDITDHRQAERETQRLQHEMAHVGRVSMMGQLASALAHEINQPLGAILRNAEAAELFMESEKPDLDEIRAILADIRSDDQRASGVIERMRTLLKRHVLDTRMLDVAELVGNVASLTRADAVTRRVKLDVAMPTDLPPVLGDRVHLQQVLLNLILNGMDAMNGAADGSRRVNVSARVDGARAVEIAVSDTGHGIPPGKLAAVFEPFFTTKPDGMGMGLSISRTIIEAHGGRLWAENNAEAGATFRFTLKSDVAA